MIGSFPKVVKPLLAQLPKNDYPVLNTRLFVECWLGFVLDRSLTSMRDLFLRLNSQNIEVDISTFSKASKQRSLAPFMKIYECLSEQVNRKNQRAEMKICPIDSTVITLTSKLLCGQGYSQVKLISGLDSSNGSLADKLVSFGKKHDYNFGMEIIEALPKKGIAAMDRGFASLEIIKQMKQNNQYFVLRISQNYKLEFLPDSEFFKVGTGTDSVVCRVVNFCDLESQKEYRLVTNLPLAGEEGLTNEEIADIYRCRWQIELLWKFLKMHLKLDELITKNVNGIAIQIYSSLIAYLLLKLVEIPQEWGSKLLDKLRYLQACMCQEISYIHWMQKIMRC
ncbi:MAG: IS4 family transposase [Cyanosarcina radialis HA8281-LM2]|jgi:putative transposase|nr:IS4 family transposase [Cyanosarcina radialis HA8281-LM2]